MLQFLVVDTDAGISELLRAEFEDSFGASVIRASNGVLAARALDALSLDLAVIEPMLPDLSGFELAERAANRNVPVLLISGHPEAQALCKDCSYPHLDKPFSLRLLRDVVRGVSGNAEQNITSLHQAYRKLCSTVVTQSRGVLDDAQQTREWAGRLVEAARRHQHKSNRLIVEARRLLLARTSLERLLILENIARFRNLLRPDEGRLGPESERMTKLLLGEEEARLLAVDRAAGLLEGD